MCNHLNSCSSLHEHLINVFHLEESEELKENESKGMTGLTMLTLS